MSYLRSIKVKNGDHYEVAHYYKCDNCGKEIFEAYSHYLGDEENQHFCVECSFLKGMITERQYVDNCGGLSSSMFQAGINLEGKIEIWHRTKKPAPWLRSDKQQRHTPKYVVWRTAVFERDNYTCQDCGQRGGELNAHHLQGFKKFSKLRHKVENGVTLCKECHKKRHKRVIE
jgi:ribosomal protein L34E